MCAFKKVEKRCDENKEIYVQSNIHSTTLDDNEATCHQNCTLDPRGEIPRENIYHKNCFIENKSEPIWELQPFDESLLFFERRLEISINELVKNCIISSRSGWLVLSQHPLQNKLLKFVDQLENLTKYDLQNLHIFPCENTLQLINNLLSIEKDFNKVKQYYLLLNNTFLI